MTGLVTFDVVMTTSSGEDACALVAAAAVVLLLDGEVVIGKDVTICTSSSS